MPRGVGVTAARQLRNYDTVNTFLKSASEGLIRNSGGRLAGGTAFATSEGTDGRVAVPIRTRPLNFDRRGFPDVPRQRHEQGVSLVDSGRIPFRKSLKFLVDPGNRRVLSDVR